MRIGIDVREACVSQPTGKGMWTRGFVSELLRRNVPVTLVTDTPVFPWTVDHAAVFAGGLRWHWQVAKYLRAQPPFDVYISPTSLIVPALIGSEFPVVPVVHDLIAFRREPHDRKAQLIERFTLKRAVMNAAHVMTVSDSTKADLLHRYADLQPERATAIYAGPMQEDVSPVQETGKAIVSIGTLCPRKNQERLIEAYRRLPQDLRTSHPLILAGVRGWQDDGIMRLLDATPGVSWKQYVSDQEYQQLLGSAAVFAFPSVYEGFGMPVLDALQRGIPVLTSDRGSLREVAGNSAIFVDPEDVGSIAAGLEKLLRDSELRSTLRRQGPSQARQFSWRRTVDLFLKAFENL